MGDILDMQLSCCDMSDWDHANEYVSPRYNRIHRSSKPKLKCNFCGSTEVFWAQSIEGIWWLHERDIGCGPKIHCCAKFKKRYTDPKECNKCSYNTTCKNKFTHNFNGCGDYHER